MNPKNGTLSRAMRNRALEVVFNFNGIFNEEITKIFGKEFPHEKIELGLFNWLCSSSIANQIAHEAFLYFNELRLESGNLKFNFEKYFFENLK